jgi:hypothetical protein
MVTRALPAMTICDGALRLLLKRKLPTSIRRNETTRGCAISPWSRCGVQKGRGWSGLRASPRTPVNCCRREPVDGVDWGRPSSIPSFRIIFRTLRSFRDTLSSLGWLQLSVNRRSSGEDHRQL